MTLARAKIGARKALTSSSTVADLGAGSTVNGNTITTQDATYASVSFGSLPISYGHFIAGNVPDGWLEFTSGSGSQADLGGGLGNELRTGTTSASESSISWVSAFGTTSNASVFRMWCRPTTVLTNMVINVCFESFDGGDWAAFVYDSSVDGNWHTETRDNGGTIEDQDTGVAVVQDSTILLEIELNASSVVFRYANSLNSDGTPTSGSTTLATTHTTEVPTSDDLRPVARVENSSTVDRRLALSAWEFPRVSMAGV